MKSKMEGGSYMLLCAFIYFTIIKLEPEAHFCLRHIDISLCSHFVYAFAAINVSDLSLMATRVDDQDVNGVKGRYSLFNDHVKSNSSGLKTLLSVGGLNQSTSSFKLISRSPRERAQFVSNVTQYLRRWNFDGLDLDWEYPEREDREDFTFLLQDLKEGFVQESKRQYKPELLLSIAAPVSKEKVSAGYDVQKISRYVDMINLMAYDFHGPWSNITGVNSPLYPRLSDARFSPEHSVEWSVNHWITLGCPPHIINLGIAGYGQSYTLTNVSSPGITGGTKVPCKVGEKLKTPDIREKIVPTMPGVDFDREDPGVIKECNGIAPQTVNGIVQLNNLPLNDETSHFPMVNSTHEDSFKVGQAGHIQESNKSSEYRDKKRAGSEAKTRMKRSTMARTGNSSNEKGHLTRHGTNWQRKTYRHRRALLEEQGTRKSSEQVEVLWLNISAGQPSTAAAEVFKGGNDRLELSTTLPSMLKRRLSSLTTFSSNAGNSPVSTGQIIATESKSEETKPSPLNSSTTKLTNESPRLNLLSRIENIDKRFDTTLNFSNWRESARDPLKPPVTGDSRMIQEVQVVTNHSMTSFGVGVASVGPGRPGRLRHLTGQLSYPEICEMLTDGGVSGWDDEQHVPYMIYADQWVGFDNIRSVAEKVTWALSKGLGGVMFWSVDLDDFTGAYCGQGRYPLLSAINNSISSLANGIFDNSATFFPAENFHISRSVNVSSIKSESDVSVVGSQTVVTGVSTTTFMWKHNPSISEESKTIIKQLNLINDTAQVFVENTPLKGRDVVATMRKDVNTSRVSLPTETTNSYKQNSGYDYAALVGVTNDGVFDTDDDDNDGNFYEKNRSDEETPSDIFKTGEVDQSANFVDNYKNGAGQVGNFTVDEIDDEDKENKQPEPKPLMLTNATPSPKQITALLGAGSTLSKIIDVNYQSSTGYRNSAHTTISSTNSQDKETTQSSDTDLNYQTVDESENHLRYGDLASETFDKEGNDPINDYYYYIAFRRDIPLGGEDWLAYSGGTFETEESEQTDSAIENKLQTNMVNIGITSNVNHSTAKATISDEDPLQARTLRESLDVRNDSISLSSRANNNNIVFVLMYIIILLT